MSAITTGSRSVECRDCDPSPGQSQSSPVGQVDVTTQGVNGGPSDMTTATAESSHSAVMSVVADSIHPPPRTTPSITIEFCDRCRWAPRATWIQTELLLTFPTPLIRSITLIPLTAPETGGRFRVWLDMSKKVELVWDRKTEGGFPELKVLKQKIRNHISPDMGLGHSDKAGAHGHGSVTIPIETTATKES